MNKRFSRGPSRGGGSNAPRRFGAHSGGSRSSSSSSSGGGYRSSHGPARSHSGFREPSGAHSSADRPEGFVKREPSGFSQKQIASGALVQVKKFNVFEKEFDRRNLFTKNLTPGKIFFAEQLINSEGVEYRAWDVSRSKLGAAIKKGTSQIGLKEGDVVLYLGASHGFTPSYVSDIIGEHGFVFCLDVAPRVVRDLVFVCEARANMAPLLADANHPESYSHLVAKEVDVVFQDISQKNQVQIFLKNCDAYLKSGGFGLLAVKARSVDVTRRPKDIFMQVRDELEKHITVVDYRELDPFERDHAFFVCKKK